LACYTHLITDTGELSAAIRTVGMPELVSTYLRAIAPRAYCDPCLAHAVQELPEPVRRTAEALAGPGQFARKVGRCRICRSTKRTVTRVDPGRFQPTPL
jgi:hypothetical protein